MSLSVFFPVHPDDPPATFATAVASGAPRIGIFFRLELPSGHIRLWLGVGDCPAAIDVTDNGGATYQGLGEIVNLPVFQQLINGAADRIELKVAGVSQRLLAMAATEADDIKGVRVLVGVGAFGPSWQLVAQPTWLRRFVVDYLSVEQAPLLDVKGSAHAVKTIGLSLRTAFTGRRRPGLSYFTDEEQQARSPGDRFCEHVARYDREVSKVWPRF